MQQTCSLNESRFCIGFEARQGETREGRKNPYRRLSGKGKREQFEADRSGGGAAKFSPEFMNRLDKVVVFHPLKLEQLDEVLEIELRVVQTRLLENVKGQFSFQVTGAGREFLTQEGTDPRYAVAPEASHSPPSGLPAGELIGEQTNSPGRTDMHRSK
jgi:hypothetical protein